MICSIVNPVLKIKPMPDNPGSPVRRCPDVNKMLRAVKGFSFVTLDEGLRRTWNWYRSHQKKGMS
jgi:dTDP-D-glucose 4,6-dehydratase